MEDASILNGLSKAINEAAGTAYTVDVAQKVSQSLDNNIPGQSLSITDIVKVGDETKNMIENSPNSAINSKMVNDALTNGDSFESFKPSFSSSGFRVELTNEDGAGYTGTIYLGSQDKPVKVLFDTGSDFLAVTSSLCNDPKLGKQEERTAVFDPKSLTFKPDNKDLRKCKSIAYDIKESESSKAIGGDDEHLDYGSAKLQGKMYTDRTCIDANKTACTNF